jgi:1-deoxy-D-xylulose-5-phosphate synthase
MPGGSCLDAFMQKYPDRCMDVGIAEGHAVTFAGGLAYGGAQKVICSIYATFFQRALDNLFQDVALQNLPVVFAIDRAGLSPSDGTTHHGVFDIGFLNAMPKLVIAQPRDGDVLKDLLASAFHWNRTACIRYPNMTTDETSRDIIERPLGKGEILIKGKDIVIIALGHMCKCAHEVRKILLESNIEATIVDPIFVKPLDTNLLFQLMLDHHYFVTIEEHSITSGLGMCINSFVMQSGFSEIQVQNFGLPDQFIEHGSYESLMSEAGLTPPKIAKEILERFSLKQPTRVHEKHWNLS